ncbi:MAG: LysR family transcriptional regulator [Hungatella sp.]|nr:LysR family transcriptional regulator [Hungatella sp.]
MMLNCQNLTYFLAVADELNFTKAAEKLFISQQALSSHIAVIEKELDVPLFMRKPSLKLTYAGEVFYRHAQKLLKDYSNLFTELKDIKEGKRGELTIGISHTRGHLLLPKILPIFMEKYPLIEIRVLEDNVEQLEQALIKKTIDFAIIHETASSPDIVYVPLFPEKILLVVSSTLLDRYENCQSIRETLKKEGKISCMEEIPFLLNKKGNISREISNRIFKEENWKPNILLETENIETIGEMCVNGIGAVFYPSFLLDGLLSEKQGGKLEVYELNYPCTHPSISVAQYKDHTPIIPQNDIVNIIKKALGRRSDTVSLPQPQ